LSKQYKSILFLMFFLSGFCGLLYQIVWLRKAFAIFGVITPVISVVISVFMIGLFLGSWAAGKWIKVLTEKLNVSAIYLYALAEFLIGIGGLSVPYLFSLSDNFLLPIGNVGSVIYLILSAFVIVVVLLPWCILMGATYPLMMAFLEKHYHQEKTSFSFLYLANVIGAMTGTLFTALFLIELFGFRNTLFISAIMNITVSLLAVSFGYRHLCSRRNSTVQYAAEEKQPKLTNGAIIPMPYMVGAVLFITGFSSMGMEVVWIRAFAPVLGNLVYSFAILLFTYLLATWLGSYIYRHHQYENSLWGIPFLIAMLSVSAFLPIVFTDPRIPFIGRIPVLSIFPLCFFLGYLTPNLIDKYSEGNPEKAGKMYAINIAGCVLGPLFASYMVLPFFGSRISIFIFALPFLWLLIKYWKLLMLTMKNRVVLASTIFVLLFVSLFVSICFEEGYKKIKGAVVRHDYTATVISFGDGQGKELLVNGKGQTGLTPITKDMAHMPLVLLKHNPQSALTICFGMGTTFRSLASWDIDVTAVELVPSVKDAFGYYHLDADRILAKPNVRIVVDDGRRFLRRTDKKFDVITIDPPPPIVTAASSLLYSEEFYSLIKSKLKPGGIVQQWLLRCEADTLSAVTTSLTRSFPYVRMFGSIAGEEYGHHYIASMSPIQVPTAIEAISRMPKAARNDRLEWYPAETLIEIWSKLLKQEVLPAKHQLNPDISITDDRPYNEYCLLRLIMTKDINFFFNNIRKLQSKKSPVL